MKNKLFKLVAFSALVSLVMSCSTSKPKAFSGKIDLSQYTFCGAKGLAIQPDLSQTKPGKPVAYVLKCPSFDNNYKKTEFESASIIGESPANSAHVATAIVNTHVASFVDIIRSVYLDRELIQAPYMVPVVKHPLLEKGLSVYKIYRPL